MYMLIATSKTTTDCIVGFHPISSLLCVQLGGMEMTSSISYPKEEEVKKQLQSNIVNVECIVQC